MAKTKIYAPEAEYSGSIGGVRFVDGVAEADEDEFSAAFAYFRSRGYGVGERVKSEPAAEEQPMPDANVHNAPLRDAAVDPEPEDFLPPVNAGKFNPHGQRVVSPQIHASETGPIHPGDVGVADTDRQQTQESELAEAVFLERQQVQEATAEAAERAQVPDDVADAAAADGDRAPIKGANKAAWIDYAVSLGASRDEAEDMSKADLQERYG